MVLRKEMVLWQREVLNKPLKLSDREQFTLHLNWKKITNLEIIFLFKLALNGIYYLIDGNITEIELRNFWKGRGWPQRHLQNSVTLYNHYEGKAICLCSVHIMTIIISHMETVPCRLLLVWYNLVTYIWTKCNYNFSHSVMQCKHLYVTDIIM